MKILFDNVLIDYGSFSATANSENYPADNMVHQFLHKRFQHTDTEYDTVTIDISPAQAVNSFFLAYSNAGKIVVRFYNEEGTLEETKTINGDQEERITTSGLTRTTTGSETRVTQSPIANDADSTYLDETYYLGEIQIDVYGGVGGYLGGVAAGVVEEFTNPISPWAEPWEDNSIITENITGQSLQDKIDPLRLYTWTFRDIKRDRANEIRSLYYTYGIGARVWVDPFEDNHDFMKPFYARINDIPTTNKNGRRYDMSWSFKEIR